MYKWCEWNAGILAHRQSNINHGRISIFLVFVEIFHNSTVHGQHTVPMVNMLFKVNWTHWQLWLFYLHKPRFTSQFFHSLKHFLGEKSKMCNPINDLWKYLKIFKFVYVQHLQCIISQAGAAYLETTHLPAEVMPRGLWQLMAKAFQESGSPLKYSGFSGWKVSQENWHARLLPHGWGWCSNSARFPSLFSPVLFG